MSKKKSGLGTGLSSLLGPDISSTPSSGHDVLQVNVDHIFPCAFQPRKHFSELELNELAESIRQNGVLQPIIVRQGSEDATYEIIAGERRWRACKKAGVRFIPVIIKEASDKEVLHYAIIENIQRENLTPIEEAESYEKLRINYNYTHEELAHVLGKSRSYISNILRLNALDEKTKEALQSKVISAGHARALIGLSIEDQEKLIQEIGNKTLSVRDLEEKIKSKKNKASHRNNLNTSHFHTYDDSDTIAVQEHLSDVLQSPVKISIVNEKPVLLIECQSFEILDLCIEKLSIATNKR